MNVEEMRTMLGLIASFDPRRVVSEATVDAWSDLFVKVEAQDAMRAVREHYAHAEEDKILMPATILKAAKTIKGNRIERGLRNGTIPRYDRWGNIDGTPESERMHAAYLLELKAQEAQRALEAPKSPKQVVVPSPFQEWEQARKQARTRPLRPMLDDLDKVEEMEANRQRYMATLAAMIEHPPSEEYAGEPEAVETEEGV